MAGNTCTEQSYHEDEFPEAGRTVFVVVTELVDRVVKEDCRNATDKLASLLQPQVYVQRLESASSSGSLDATNKLKLKNTDNTITSDNIKNINGPGQESADHTSCNGESEVNEHSKISTNVPNPYLFGGLNDLESIQQIRQSVQIFFDKFRQSLLGPGPTPEMMTVWRNVVSTAYRYPCILKHEDLRSLYELFLLLGIKLQCDNTDIYIELEQKTEEAGEETGKPKPTFPCKHMKLRPPLPAKFNGHSLTPVNLIFGHIEDFEYDLVTRVVILKKYGLLPNIKRGVDEMVQFLLSNPDQLYADSLGFIYDFLIRFGVTPKKVAHFVKLLIEGDTSNNSKPKGKQLRSRNRKRKSQSLEYEDQENADTDVEQDTAQGKTRKLFRKTKQKNKIRIMTELNNNHLKRKSGESESAGEEEEISEGGTLSSSNSEISESSDSSSETDEEPFDKGKGKRFGKRKHTSLRNQIKRKYLRSSPSKKSTMQKFRTGVKRKLAFTDGDGEKKKKDVKNHKIRRSSISIDNSNSNINTPPNSNNTTVVKVNARRVSTTKEPNNNNGVTTKPFPCLSTSGCGSAYSRQYEMIQHFARCHANEPVPPEIQEKVSKVKREVENPTRMSKVKNEDKPIACPSKTGCPVRFIWQRSMHAHCRKKHADEVELLEHQHSPTTPTSGSNNNNNNVSLSIIDQKELTTTVAN